MQNIKTLAKEVKIQAEAIQDHRLMFGETPIPLNRVIRTLCSAKVTDNAIDEYDLDLLYREAMDA